MGKLLMRTETPSWRTLTPTCRFYAADSLSPRRWIILCDSTAETACTPDIYRVTLPRTAASSMPEQYAIAFFNSVQVGTPVTVFGRTPVNRYYSGASATGFSAPSTFRPIYGSRLSASASSNVVAVNRRRQSCLCGEIRFGRQVRLHHMQAVA
jgi:hypothetical protein